MRRDIMAHEHHGHDHSHAHEHGSVKNIKNAFLLNISFVVIEIVGGLLTNSVAILSDAIHDLGDSISLGLAWYLEKLGDRESDHKFNYGYKRFSILGALFNILVLIGGTFFVVYHAIPRLLHPESVKAEGMIALAVVGVIINGLAVLNVKKGKKLSEKVVTLHLLEDVFGWVAVLVVSIVLLFFDLPVLDPILSLLISAYIIKNVISGLIRITKMLLQGVPDGFVVRETTDFILDNTPQALDVHDMRAWTLDGEENVLTFHMAVDDGVTVAESIEMKRHIKDLLAERGFKYVTIEVENIDDCSDKNCPKRTNSCAPDEH
jgi:cobalt-zinc-cadmium efflux system protein